MSSNRCSSKTLLYLIAFFRVCNGWKQVISRKGAPFLRSVITSTDNFRRCIFGPEKQVNHRFWSFASDVKTVIVCGEAEDSVSSKSDCTYPIRALWDSYTTETYIHGRPLGINKVVYANMVVHSAVFCCPAVLQVGFETMLYRSTLKVPIADILRHGAGDVRFTKLFAVDYIELKITGLEGRDSYIASAADVKEMEIEQTSRRFCGRSNNPVAEYFGRNHCTHLEDSQLALLAR